MSDGLLHLLLNRRANTKEYREKWLDTYVDILYNHGGFRRSDGQKHFPRGQKFDEIVRPRLAKRYPHILEKSGSGYSDLKPLRQKRSGPAIDVIVGNAEELLDQLQMIFASLDAGNTSNLMKNKAIAILDTLFK